MTAELLTTGKIAEATGASPAKIKKAIADLGLVPVTKKGCCAYYDDSALAKISAKLKG